MYIFPCIKYMYYESLAESATMTIHYTIIKTFTYNANDFQYITIFATRIYIYHFDNSSRYPRQNTH